MKRPYVIQFKRHSEDPWSTLRSWENLSDPLTFATIVEALEYFEHRTIGFRNFHDVRIADRRFWEQAE